MSARRLARAVGSAVALGLAVPSVVLLTTAAAEPTADPTATATATATTSPSATTSPTATESATGPFTVDDAQLRWGINDESNNAAFAPGTFNFLSAGEIADPGAGGTTLASTGTGATWSNGRPAGWSAQSGEVRIEKRQADGDYATATFAGTSTDATGTRLTTSGSTFSDHQVVIDGGTGTVDPEAGTATIAWDGTFTVLYYSGMTFFMVSDPELRVTASKAQLLGTVSGYASDMNDTSEWTEVPGEQVVLADLPRAGLTLPTEGGFSATPAYAGVRYDAPGDGVTQIRSGSSWGAFPTSYLTYMQKVGAAAYWYSSGGSADPHKVAKPLTVSYSAGDPVAVPTEPEPTTGSTDDGGVTPSTSVAPTPPTETPTPTATATTQPAGPALPGQSAAALAPPAATPPAVAPQTFDPRLPAVPVVTALTSPVASEAISSGHPWEWWAGSLLLLGAVALTTLSTLSSLKGKS